MPNTRTKVTKMNTDPTSKDPALKESKRSQDLKVSAAKEEETYCDQSECQQVTANDIVEQPVPRKGRGRPKKTTSTEGHPDQKAAPPVKAKRRQQDAPLAANEVENEPANKRTKINHDGAGENQPLLSNKTDKILHKAGTIARDKLPDRKGRNVHPVPKPHVRRSSQEVEAEREEKRRALEKRIQQLEDAKRLLAETNVLEDIEGDSMDVTENPKRLSPAIHKHQRGNLEEDGNNRESFTKDVDNILSTSEREDESAKQEVSCTILLELRD